MKTRQFSHFPEKKKPYFLSRKSRNSRLKSFDASRPAKVSRVSKVSSLDPTPICHGLVNVCQSLIKNHVMTSSKSLAKIKRMPLLAKLWSSMDSATNSTLNIKGLGNNYVGLPVNFQPQEINRIFGRLRRLSKVDQ